MYQVSKRRTTTLSYGQEPGGVVPKTNGIRSYWYVSDVTRSSFYQETFGFALSKNSARVAAQCARGNAR